LLVTALAGGLSLLLAQRVTAAPDCTKPPRSCAAEPGWASACGARGSAWCAPGGGEERLKKVTPATQTPSVSPIGAVPSATPVFRLSPIMKIVPKQQPALPAKVPALRLGTRFKPAPGSVFRQNSAAVAHPAADANGFSVPSSVVDVDSRHFVIGATHTPSRTKLAAPGGHTLIPAGQIAKPEGANAKADFIFKGMELTRVFGEDAAKRLAKENAAIRIRRPYVGDPLTQPYHFTSPLPDQARWVHSCDDYVYKKYFEYNWFLDSVQALGSDYRAIFDVATRADSPVRITRHLRSFGPDAPPQVMDQAVGTKSGTGKPITVSFDFTNTVAATLMDWNSFYGYFASLNQSLHRTSRGVGKDTSVWAGVADENGNWLDVAIKLEKTHTGFSDEELEAGAARSKHLAALVNQLRQVEWGTATNFCKQKNGIPEQISSPDHVSTVWTKASCLVRRDGKPVTMGSNATGGSTMKCGGKPCPPVPQAQSGSQSSTFDTLPIPDTFWAKSAGALIVQQDIDDAIAAERSLLATNPKLSCLNPDPLASACTWSYRRFAGAVQDVENDVLNELTHNFLGNTIATLAGPSFDLAQCHKYLPDFDVLWDAKGAAAHKGNDRIFDAIVPKRTLWWSAYQPTKPTGDVYGPSEPQHAAFARGYWASDWSKVEAFFREIDRAGARWGEFAKDQQHYYEAVTTIQSKTAALPWDGKSLGQSSADNFDQGNPDLFAASADYNLSWRVDMGSQESEKAVAGGPASTSEYANQLRTNSPIASKDACHSQACAMEKYVCRLNGTMAAGTHAAALVLGGTIPILSADFHSSATGSNAHMDAHFAILGDELVQPPVKFPGMTQSSTGTFNITAPAGGTSTQVPDPPFEIDFAVGPIPVSLQAGLVLSAGIDLSTTGQVGDTCHAPGLPGVTKPGTVSAPPFQLTSTIDPWVSVDGFAQAGVDLVFVQAGVRIDLQVIRLGIPLSVGLDTVSNPNNLTFGTHANATFDSLSGEVSAFVEVDYLVGSAEFVQPVFGWDGLHASKPLFAYNQKYDMESINYRVNPPGDPLIAQLAQRQ